MNLDDIFKAYDVRGTYPDQLNEDIAERTGKAFAQFVQSDTVIIGRDMRESGPSLVDAIVRGVTSQGKDVQLAGLMPTDATYFAAGHFNLPSIMVTASHNPSQYNGFKLTDAGAVPIGDESGLRDIRDMVERNDFADATDAGQVSEIDVMGEYVKHVLTFIDQDDMKPLKVAIDAGNGMGGFASPKVFEHLPCEVVPMYFELDGSFPNHSPNPIEPENVQDLIEKVRAQKCDVGIAFDGDADRAYFIDETGGRISASLITAMIAKNMLEKTPGATMIYNAVCSKIVPDVIEENGGTAVMERVGHSYIKKTMKENGAIFAGEHSGHYYFLDNYRADSGMIAALIVLQMISRAGKPFSEMLQEFHRYHAIEETNSEVEDKQAAIARVKEKFSDAEMLEFDGVTFTYEDFWFNVRASNTEPVLRLNLEARTPELRDEKAAEVLQVIRS
jgi:phosphomannomutase